MKGLHGGIPLTVLAAVARAQVLGGTSGNDAGPNAAVPVDSYYENHEYTWSKDDHSLHIDHDIPPWSPFRAPDAPAPVFNHGPARAEPSVKFGVPSASPQPSMAGAAGVSARAQPSASASLGVPSASAQLNQARGLPHSSHPPATVMGGPSGDDVGNNFVAPISGFYSSEFNNWDHDDHSVDIDDDYQDPYGGFARRDGRPGEDVTVQGGPSGDDSGNNLVAPVKGYSSTDINNWSEDDHSVDIDNGNHDYTRRAWPADDTTVSGGPSGDDSGSSIVAPVKGYSWTDVHSWSEDDHSVDIDNGNSGYTRRAWPGDDTTVQGGPSGDDSGNNLAAPITGYSSTDINNWSEDDHSVDIDNGNHDYTRRAWPGDDTTVQGGPSGDDSGNNLAASISGFSSTDINSQTDDDHSVDVDNGNYDYTRRAWPGDDTTVQGGPSGDDTGNNLVMPITGVTSTEFNNWRDDDHSVDVDNGNRDFQRRADPGTTVAGGPSGDDTGNNLVMPITGVSSESSTNVDDDDHSITVDNHDYRVPRQSGRVFAAAKSQTACSHASVHAPQTVTKTVFQPASETPNCPSQMPVQAPTPSVSRMVVKEPCSCSPTSVFGVLSSPASSAAHVTPMSSDVSPSRFGPSSSSSLVPSSSSSFVPYTGGAGHLSATAGIASVVCGLVVLALAL